MKNLFLTIVLFASQISAQVQDSNPFTIACRIAERIMSETTFELTTAEQKSALDLQVIDFSKAFCRSNEKYAYAFSTLSVKKNIKLKFGISYSAPIKVWLNGKLIFQNNKQAKFYFKEAAYSIFKFQDTVTFSLNKGLNRLVIFSSLHGEPVIFLREITGAEEKPVSEFLPVFKEPASTWQWCFTGSESIYKKGANSYPPNSSLKRIYNCDESLKDSIIFIKPAVLKKLAENPGRTFKKESFADWSYPNGALMMTMLNLWKATGDEKYHKYVEKYCAFINDNIPLFRKQYFKDHDLRVSFYRIFRKSMLDDVGAASLPFAELSMQDHIHNYDSLLTAMSDFILKGQSRLADGTLCRPEPEEWTIWADDLFMSVPLLVRMGVITGKNIYFNEATKQIINFNKYLFDPGKKLYKHGWFSRAKQRSKVFWGRANGWVVWAETEALKFFPAEDRRCKEIKNIFKEHLEGILTCQDESGMWHQVLDDSSSFEETSCSAMFIAGLSYGIRNGIIDKGYSDNVLKAWSALQKKISRDGVVKDICCGTGIGMNAEFYNLRERYDNDLRGLGAVINAGIEVSALKKFLEK